MVAGSPACWLTGTEDAIESLQLPIDSQSPADAQYRQCRPLTAPVDHSQVRPPLIEASVVVKDLRLNDENKDKESSFKDKDKDKDLMSKDENKDEDLKIGPRGSSRTIDPRGQGLSSRTTHRVSNKRVGLLEIQSCQSTSHTLVTS